MVDEHVGRATDWLGDRLTQWNPPAWTVASDWQALVDQFFTGAAGMRLGAFVQSRLAAEAVVYPPQPLRALTQTPKASVKVVILGQDPYHGPGQAHGLAFSVGPGVRLPPSLGNVRAEIARERLAGELAVAAEHDPATRSGDLTRWARQGVLLLNTCLTVEQGQAGSHSQQGWEVLTDLLIQAVNQKTGPLVFMLWGAHAQAGRPKPGTEPKGAPRLHLLANHPSPLSARRKPVPFIGCGHFARANDFLIRHGAAPVDW